MRQTNLFFDRVNQAANVYSEAMPGVPLIEISGCHRFLLENHHGIIAYCDKEIRAKVSYGYVCICGSGLELAKMTKEKLVITGKITSVSLNSRRDK